VRREAEIKLHPLQQKEADLIEELSRQKEKERLRKVFFFFQTDLCDSDSVNYCELAGIH
jgi:hypothetical protein